MEETEKKASDQEADDLKGTGREGIQLAKELGQVIKKSAGNNAGFLSESETNEGIPAPMQGGQNPLDLSHTKDASSITGDSATTERGRKSVGQGMLPDRNSSLQNGGVPQKRGEISKPQRGTSLQGAKKTANASGAADVGKGLAGEAAKGAGKGSAGAVKAGGVAGGVGLTGVGIFLLVLLVILVAFAIAYSVYETGERRGDHGSVSNFWISENRPLTEEEQKRNAICVYGILKKEGFSMDAVAAVLANMEAESTINPGRWENGLVRGGGYGLCQWTPYTKITGQRDYKEDDGDMQMAYFLRTFEAEWIDKSGYCSALEFREGKGSAEDLAAAFLICYERPLAPGDTLAIRKQKAARWKTYLMEHGDEELKKRTDFSFTIEDLKHCKSRQEYLSLVMPAYQVYGREFGIRYPGILALQVFYEVNASFPQEMSAVATKDNNFGGLKYASGIPRATMGSPYPASEGSGVYCHFETPGDYIYAQCWNVGQSLYAVARERSDVESFARSLCAIWIKGDLSGTAQPVGYSEQLLADYRLYHLEAYEN
jgi:hypothetical protein